MLFLKTNSFNISFLKFDAKSSFFLRTFSYSASKIKRSHLRLRRTHFIHRSESSLTRHFIKRLKQFLHFRIIKLLLLQSFWVNWRRFKIKFNGLIIRQECIETTISEHRNLKENLVLKIFLRKNKIYTVNNSTTRLWARRSRSCVNDFLHIELKELSSDLSNSEAESLSSISDSSDRTILLYLYNDNRFLR